MTEEDQLLVAKAALAGVRFWRLDNDICRWTSSMYPSVNTGCYTIGRAAMWALFDLKMVTAEEREEYLNRTHNDAYHEAEQARANAVAVEA